MFDMKRGTTLIYLIIGVLFQSFLLPFSRAQEVVWQKCIGGSAFDNATAFEIACSGSYVVVGSTLSYDVPNMDKSGGDSDVFAVKIDFKGRILWKKYFGGKFAEEAKDIKVTPRDCGFIIVGFTDSDNLTNGQKDFYVVRLDAIGTKLWEKAYGGSGNDVANAVLPLRDGSGYIVAGETGSRDKNVTKNAGGVDFWLVKLGPKGDLLWEKTFGGTGNEQIRGIWETADGYILVGPTDSKNGDITENKGKTDIFIVKVDKDGRMLWKKTFGGPEIDDAYDITATTDGNIMVVGTSASPTGDLGGTNGGFDAFILKLSQDGRLIWSKHFGGTLNEGASSIQQTLTKEQVEYLVAGTSSSKDGTLLENKGKNDAWLYKVSGQGDMIWQKVVGGKSDDQFLDAKEVPGGDYVAIGFSSSIDGDLDGIDRRGGNDCWVAMFKEPAVTGITSLPPTTLIGYVRDAETKKFIKSDVILVDDKNNKVIGRDDTDTLTGHYMIFLPIDTSRASVGASAPGYLFYSKDVTVSEKERYSDVRLDIELKPIKKGASVNSYSIYFELGKYNLKPESYPELDRVVNFLKQNPTVRLSINGHTDASGEPQTKKLLSKYRAEEVRKYLASKGIAATRMESQGYGMDKPIDTNDTEEGRTKNRRVEFQITGF